MSGTKAKIRALVKERKSNYNAAELETLSVPPLFGIETDTIFLQAEKIAIYWSLPDEVCTHQFIDKWHNKKQFYLPVMNGDELKFAPYKGISEMKDGPFKINEPTNSEFIDPKDLEVVIVPGIAFDAKGCRLGRGKGLYDGFLIKTKAEKLGLAFSFQMFDAVPIESHDIKLDKVYF